MGVDHGAFLIAGLDGEAPLEEGGSLLDRFLAGAWGDVPDRDTAAHDNVPARVLFEEWAAHDEVPAGLRAYQAGSVYAAENLPEATRLVVGVEVLAVEMRDSASGMAGPVSLAALQHATERARAAFRELGIEAEPRIFLVGREA